MILNRLVLWGGTPNKKRPESPGLILMQGTNRRLAQSSSAQPQVLTDTNSQCFSAACAVAYLCFYNTCISVTKCSALSLYASGHNVDGFTSCLLTALVITALHLAL